NPCGALSASEKAGYGRSLRIRIHIDAAHDVMRRRTDFHRRLSYIHIPQLLKLVVHTRQLAFDMLGRIWQLAFDPGNIEKHSAVRTGPSFLDFPHNAAGDVITREQFGGTPGVPISLSVAPTFFFVVGSLALVVVGYGAEHETLPLLICQDASFPAHA